jgi:hypothetical protein
VATTPVITALPTNKGAQADRPDKATTAKVPVKTSDCRLRFI